MRGPVPGTELHLVIITKTFSMFVLTPKLQPDMEPISFFSISSSLDGNSIVDLGDNNNLLYVT